MQIYGPKTAGAWGSGTSLIGPTGPAGAAGTTGPTGPAGTTGAAGPQGPIGNTGAIGPQGPSGAQGPVGNTGATGPQGPVGATGPAGAQGPIGNTGATGATGAAGAVGATGAAGPQGPAGSAITAPPVLTVSSDWLATASDFSIFCNVSAANRVITLPSAPANAGRIYVVKRVGTGNNYCRVMPVQGGNVDLDNAAFVARGITV